jgi:hypothetical protein
MNNGANLVQVYAVIGGWSYEGESFDSLRLFDCESAARQYEEHLKVMEGFDYVRVAVREVAQHSAIAA